VCARHAENSAAGLAQAVQEQVPRQQAERVRAEPELVPRQQAERVACQKAVAQGGFRWLHFPWLLCSQELTGHWRAELVCPQILLVPVL
jgi:hypothetical protein